VSDKDLTEKEIDIITGRSMVAVREMIDKADFHGLLVEVVHSYGDAMESHGDVFLAISEALNEWDID